MKNTLEKFGSFGAIIAAAACPICFPKLAFLGTVFGLGVLAPFETAFFYAVQILVVMAVVGHFVSYKRHQNETIVLLASLSAVLLFLSLYLLGSEFLSYVGFGGLIVATVWLGFENRRCVVCVNSIE